MSQETLYFDDLKVGDTFTTGTFEVSAADINRFAAEFATPAAFPGDIA
jgi:hypothetical protein